ncbi:MAG: hypothetical protein ACI861_002135, partial [Paracoccaceae bacterium]
DRQFYSLGALILREYNAQIYTAAAGPLANN